MGSGLLLGSPLNLSQTRFVLFVYTDQQYDVYTYASCIAFPNSISFHYMYKYHLPLGM